MGGARVGASAGYNVRVYPILSYLSTNLCPALISFDPGLSSIAFNPIQFTLSTVPLETSTCLLACIPRCAPPLYLFFVSFQFFSLPPQNVSPPLPPSGSSIPFHSIPPTPASLPLPLSPSSLRYRSSCPLTHSLTHSPTHLLIHFHTHS